MCNLLYMEASDRLILSIDVCIWSAPNFDVTQGNFGGAYVLLNIACLEEELIWILSAELS